MKLNHTHISGNLLCEYRKAEKKLERFLQDERAEIKKWGLGIKLCGDPLNDRSINDICLEWISKYAAEFRINWEIENGKVTEEKDGNHNPKGSGRRS